MKRGDSSQLITIPEVTRRGVPPRPFRRAVRDGEIEVFDLGGWPRVRWPDVLAWIDKHRRYRRSDSQQP